MFFAPALRNDAMTAPRQTPSDYGLERFLRNAFGGLAPTFHDMEEDEQSWTLRVDVPGVPREQLRVQISGNTVEVETDKECRRQVRARYDLPAEIDVDGSEAKLQDGVLSLKLAKAASAVARRIEVR